VKVHAKSQDPVIVWWGFEYLLKKLSDRFRGLGAEPASLDELKACLKTVEGVRWTMTKEERTAKTKRQKPTVSDPGGLF